MKTRPEWASLSGPKLLDEIEQRKKLISEMVGQFYPSILKDEIADLQALFEASPFQHGRLNCYQDSCENAAFSCIGGLDKRAAMEAPDFIKKRGEKYSKEYLEGYQAAAKEMYGADWMTCKFGWYPMVVIGGGLSPRG